MNPLTWTLPSWYIVAAVLGLARIGWGWRERVLELLIRDAIFLGILIWAYLTTGTSPRQGGTVIAWTGSPAHLIIAGVLTFAVMVKVRHPRKRWGSRK